MEFEGFDRVVGCDGGEGVRGGGGGGVRGGCGVRAVGGDGDSLDLGDRYGDCVRAVAVAGTGGWGRSDGRFFCSGGGGSVIAIVSSTVVTGVGATPRILDEGVELRTVSDRSVGVRWARSGRVERIEAKGNSASLT